MKAIIFIVLVFISVLGSSVYAQEGVVLDIPNSAPILIVDMDGPDWTNTGSLPGNKTNSLMTLDIFGWNGLYKKYNTELKRKVFLDTEEGKRLLGELKEERKKVIASTAYLVYRIGGHSLFKEDYYDLKTKTYNIRFQPDFPSIPGYIHFPGVVVKCNLPVKQEPYVTSAKNKTITPPYNYYNIIKLPMSEQTALSIENNASHLKFVLEFKIEQYKNPVWYIEYFQGTAINMYIIDEDSHEIYYAVDKSRLKVLKAQQEKIRQEQEKIRQEKLRQEELARQEMMRRQEEIGILWQITDRRKEKKQMNAYWNKRILEEAKKINAQYPIPKEIDINEDVEVLTHIDSTTSEIVRLAGQNLNNELYALFKDAKYYCSDFWDDREIKYYRFENHFFCEEKDRISGIVEKGLLGVKVKKGVLEYYGNFPEEVKKWCEMNIVGTGFQTIQYTRYYDTMNDANVQCIVEPVTVDKETAQIIQGKNPQRKERKENYEKDGEAEIFQVVETMPSFNGNINKFLKDNVKYPAIAQENGISGRVFVSFVVEKDGSITDVKVTRPVDPALDKEAVRVVKSMPKWNPGKQRNKPVRVSYIISIDFTVSN